MEEGFILDRAHYGMAQEPRWQEGAAEPSFWTGLKTSGRRSLAVHTWRCESCGFLESYATGRVVRGC